MISRYAFYDKSNQELGKIVKLTRKKMHRNKVIDVSFNEDVEVLLLIRFMNKRQKMIVYLQPKIARKNN